MGLLVFCFLSLFIILSFFFFYKSCVDKLKLFSAIYPNKYFFKSTWKFSSSISKINEIRINEIIMISAPWYYRPVGFDEKNKIHLELENKIKINLYRSLYSLLLLVVIVISLKLYLS